MSPEVREVLVFINDILVPWRIFMDAENLTFEMVFRSAISTVLYAFFGWMLAHMMERRRYRHLAEREAKVADISVTHMAHLGTETGISTLVSANAVFCHDFFRGFLILLRKLVGGEIRHYHRLVEFTRREALCRLREEAKARGITEIKKLRIEENSLA